MREIFRIKLIYCSTKGRDYSQKLQIFPEVRFLIPVMKLNPEFLPRKSKINLKGAI